jgi:hypothetical protein
MSKRHACALVGLPNLVSLRPEVVDEIKALVDGPL